MHKEAVIHLFGQSIIYCHLRNSVSLNLNEFMDDPAGKALELMGLNPFKTPDKFTDDVYRIIQYYAEKVHSFTHFKAMQLGKKVYKAVKLELAKYDRKSMRYE